MGLRVVFMGTPEFAVATLDALAKSSHHVLAVVTVPDKPAGRGQQIQESPVKQYAVSNNIPVLQPEKLKDEQFVEKLEKLDAEIYIVVAFRMLPEVVWSMPHLGTINLHGSLLPQYRGAAPINWAVMNGETETGVTTFFIEKEIDTGNILFQEKFPISETDNAGDVHDKMMAIGAKLVISTLDAIERKQIRPFPQSKFIKDVTSLKPAPKIFKDDCRIDWNADGKTIYNKIRGLSPYPAAWSILSGAEHLSVKIFEAQFIPASRTEKPGTILTDNKKELQVVVKDGTISIKSLQVEGKKKLNTEEFLRGFHEIEKYQFK